MESMTPSAAAARRQGVFHSAIRRVVAIAIAASLFGGASYAQRNQKQVKGSTVKITAAVPSLAPMEETAPSQAKGGLRITTTSDAFKAEETWVDEAHQVPPPMISFQPAPNAIYVEKSRTPRFAVSPDHLVFHVHLNNGLPRVFRGSGIAVQFNIAGKVSSADPTGFGDLANLILPPRSEQEVTILGPKLADIPAPSTVGVFLYDVVTAMDQAGNVTEKQNFEWYFSYRTQSVEREFNVPPAQRGWVIPH